MTLPPGTMPTAPPAAEAPTPPAPAAPAHDTAPSATPAPAPTTGRSAVLPDNVKRDSGTGTITGRDLHKMGLVELPKDKRFSLAVIQGAGYPRERAQAAGQEHERRQQRKTRPRRRIHREASISEKYTLNIGV